MKKNKLRIATSYLLILVILGNPMVAAAANMTQAHEDTYNNKKLSANSLIKRAASTNVASTSNSNNSVSTADVVVSKSANGTAVYNIVAPTNKGVSVNKFDSFNVGTNGAIFNNSYDPTVSQLGGWLDGNRQLAGGSAKIILSEVTGSSTSNLLGYTEIAGNSAEFILANPNGITCSGCGFINTPRVSLVTGSPTMLNGDIAGFNMGSGEIAISGSGLDASAVDRFDLLSRAISVNAAIYANKLNLLTGNDYYDYQSDAMSSTSSGDNDYTVSLDVSALGGMYANSIKLVGTEKGLGVSSQGVIRTEDLELDADGQIRLKDTQGTGQFTITSRSDGIENTGTLYGGNVSLNAESSIANDGLLASSKDITVEAGSLNQNGNIFSGLKSDGTLGSTGNIKLQLAETLENHGQIAAPESVYLSSKTLTNDGYIQADNLKIVSDNSVNTGTFYTNYLSLTADTMHSSGNLLSLGKADFDIADFSNSGQLVSNAEVEWTGNSFTNQSSGQVLFYGSKDTDFSLNTLTNSGLFEVTADDFTLALASFDNTNGTLSHLGKGSLVLSLDDELNNSSGTVQTNGTLAVNAATITNSSGQLSAQTGLTEASQSLVNNSGSILTNGDLHLTINTFDNGNGTVAAENIIGQFDKLKNDGGLIQAANNGTINADNLVNNATGIIQASALKVNANTVDNSGTLTANDVNGEFGVLQNSGVIGADNNLTLSISGDQANNAGSLFSGNDLAINAQGIQFDNSHGLIQSGDNLKINVSALINAGGQVQGQNSQLDLTSLNNNDGQVLGTSTLAISANDLSNQEGAVGGGELNLYLDGLDNNLGSIQASNTARLDVSGTLDNGNGQILLAGNQGDLSATSLSNGALGVIQLASTGNLALAVDGLENQGEISSLGKIGLTALTLNNQGLIAADDVIDINANVSNTGQLSANKIVLAASNMDNSGQINAGQTLQVTTENLSNTGQIGSAGNSQITAAQQVLNQGDILVTGISRIDSAALVNGGQIFGGDSLELNAKTLSNQQGSMLSNGLLNVQGHLNNSAGTIQGQDLSLVLSGDFNNSQGTVLANGTLQLSSDSLKNDDGLLQGNDLALQQASLDNAGQILAANQLTIKTDSFNNIGLVQAASADIQTSGLLTNNGQITGQRLSLNTETLNNEGGLLLSSGSEGDSLSLTTTTAIDNQNGIIQSAGDGLSFSQSVVNNGGQIQLLGQGQLTLAGLSNGEGLVYSAGDLSQSGSLDNQQGQLVAGGSLTLSGTDIANQSGLIQAGSNLSVTADNLKNNNGQLASGNDLAISLTQALDNTNGLVAHGGDGQLQADTLSNQQGQWLQSSSGTLNINTNTLDNSQGVLASNGTVVLSNQQLNNVAGQIQASDLAINTNDLNNQNGKVASQSALTINASDVDNRQGQIAAGQLTLKAQQLSNDGGLLQADDASALTLLGALDNGDGQILAANNSQISAASLVNGQQGLIQVSGDGELELTISGKLDNVGEISSLGELGLQAQALSNQGTVAANGAMGLSGIIDNSGELSANNLTLSGEQFTNKGEANAGESLLINSDAIVNQGHIGSSGDSQIVTNSLDNSQGEVVAMGINQINAEGLKNDQGLIHGEQGLAISGSVLSNDNGTLQANADISIDADTVDNQGGSLLASADITVESDTLNNQSGLIQGQNVYTSVTGQLDNSQGQLLAQQRLVSNAGQLLNTEGLIQGTNVSFSGSSLNNSGTVASSQQLTLNADNILNSGVLQGQQITASIAAQLQNSGQISADQLTINADDINNDAGTLLATGTDGESLQINANKTISNLGGTIESDGTLLNVKQSLDNTDGQVVLLGAGLLQLSHLSNNNGLVYSAGNVAQQGSLDNDNGQLQAQGSLTISSEQLSNQAGLLQAGQQLAITADSLANQKGTIAAGAGITLTLNGLLNNSNGQLQNQAGAVNITADSVNNQQGLIYQQGTGPLLLNAQFDNENGQLLAQGDLTLQSTSISNNGGQVGASNITIDSDSITNNGVVQAQQTLSVKTTDLDNGNGSLMALGQQADALQLDTSGQFLNDTQGQIASAGGIVIAADALTNKGLISAATDLGATLLTLSNSGRIESGGQLDITGDLLTNSGTVLASGNLNLEANTRLDNSGGILVSQSGNLSLTANNVINDGGHIAANQQTVEINGATSISNVAGVVQADSLQLQTNGDLNNSQGTISANQLSVTAHHVNNSEGQLYSSGTADDAMMLNIDSLDNDQGLVSSAMTNWQLALTSLDNGSGQLLHLGSGQFLLNVEDAVTSSGTIGSNGALTLTADSLDNQGALVAQTQLALDAVNKINNTGTVQGNTVSLTASNVDNSGQINSADTLTANVADTLNNSGQLYAASGAMSVTATHMINQGTVSANDLNLNLSDFTNSGRVQAQQGIAVTTNTLSNQADGVLSGQAVTVTGLQSASNAGVVQANALTLSGTSLTNSGVIAAVGNTDNALALNLASVTNQIGGTLYSNGTDLSLGGSLNNSGTLTHNGTGTLTLGNKGSITNNGTIQTTGKANLVNGISGGGALYAQQQITLSGDSFSNNGSYLASGGDLLVNTGLSNVGGTLLAAAGLTVNTTGNVSNSGIIQGNSLNIKASSFDNQNGRLVNAGTGVATVDVASLDNRQGSIQAAGSSLSLSSSASINNDGGQIYSAGSLNLATQSGMLSNSSGSIVANGLATLDVAGDLNNAAGSVSAEQLDLGVSGTLTNTGGNLLAVGATSSSSQINAATLNNSGGTIASDNANLTITTSGTFSNGSGQVVHVGSGTLDLNSNALTVASAGQINSNGSLNVTTTKAVNNAGTISAAGNTSINAANISNSGILGSRAGVLSLTSAGTFTNQGQASGYSGLVLNLDTLTNKNTLQSDSSIVATLNKVTQLGSLAAANVSASVQNDLIVGSGDTVSATGTIALASNGNVTNNGSVTAGTSLQLSGKNLTNNSALKGGSGNSVLDFSGTIVNGTAGQISGTGNVVVEGNNVSNNGAIAAGKVLEFDAGTLTNNSLIYAGSQLQAWANTVNNQNGAVLYSSGDLYIAANSNGDKANSINNISSTIAAGNNLTLTANTILNKRTGVSYTAGTVTETGDSPVYDTDAAKTQKLATTYKTREDRVTTAYTATATGKDAQIISGGDMALIGGNITNQYGTIAAGNNLTLSGTNLTNTAAMNKEETDVTVYSDEYQGKCMQGASRSGVYQCTEPGDFSYVASTQTDSYHETNYTGGAFGTITAGGNISGNLAGSFDNAGDAGQYPDAINTTASGSKGSASRGTAATSVTGKSGNLSIEASIPTDNGQYTKQSDQTVSTNTPKQLTDNANAGGQADTGSFTAVTDLTLEANLTAADGNAPDKSDLAHTEDPSINNPSDALASSQLTVIASSSDAGNQGTVSDNTELTSAPQQVAGTHAQLTDKQDTAYTQQGSQPDKTAASITLNVASDSSIQQGAVSQALTVSSGANDSTLEPDGLNYGNLALQTGYTVAGQGYTAEDRTQYLSKDNYYNTGEFQDELGVDPSKVVKTEDQRQQQQLSDAANDDVYSASADAQSATNSGILSDEQVRILTEDMGLDSAVIDDSQQALYASLDNLTLLDNGDLIAAGGDIAISADQGITNNAGISAGGQLALLTSGDLDNTNFGSLTGGDSLYLDIGGDANNAGVLEGGSGSSYLNIGGNLNNSGSLTATDLTLNATDLNNNSTIAADNINLTLSGDLNNNASLNADTDLIADVANNINNNGSLVAGAGLSLTAGQNIYNNQSLIQGADVSLTATNGDIVNRTEYQQYTTGNAKNNTTYTVVGDASQIVSTNSLSMSAGNNLDLQGSSLAAAGDINLHADNDVLLAAVENVTAHESHSSGGYDIAKDITYDVVDLNAGGNLTVSAGNNLESEGAQFNAGSDVALAAGNQMDLDAVVETHSESTKTTTKHTFSKKVTQSESLAQTVEGTSINAGGDILLNAGKDSDGSIGLIDGGDVTLTAANLNAGGNIVANGDDVTVSAATYQNYDYSHTSKSSFGGLKSKSKDDLEQTAQLQGSSLNAGGNVVLNAGDDLGILASDITATGSVGLRAGGDMVISSGEETSNSEHKSQSGGLFSGGQIFSSTQITDGVTKVTANDSSITAGGDLTINADSATVIGSTLSADGAVTATTESGDINFLAATETEQSYHSEKSVAVGFGDLGKIITGSLDTAKATLDEAKDDHRLAFNIAKASYHQADTTTTTTTHVGTDVSAGSGINLNSAGSVAIEGSTLTADADQDQSGDLNIKAAGDVTVGDVTDTYGETNSSVDGSAELNITVSNAYVDAADAALALVDAKDQLKDAKDAYGKYKDQLSDLNSQLQSLQQQLANGEPGVSQDDIDELQDQISMLNSDKDWYLANIALAAENVASKTTLLAQQTATAAASTGTYGFNAGMELNVDATKASSSLAQSSSVGSSLSGQNLTIQTGSGNALAITGSDVVANGDMTLDVGSLSVQAGVSTSDSASSSEHGDVTISQTVYGAAAGGPTVNASYSANSAQDHSTTYTNSQLQADNMTINVAGDADLEGANLAASSSLNADIGGNLSLISQQNTSSGNNHGMSVSGGVSFAGVEKPSDTGKTATASSKNTKSQVKETVLGQAGSATGGSGGFSVSNGSYSNTDTVLSSIISGGELNLNVGGNTQLTGAMIASVDDNGNDLGELNFSTGSLTYTNLTDRHLQSSSSVSVNANISTSNTPAGSGTQPTDSTGNNLAINSANLGIHDTSSNEKSKVLATVGQGNVTVGGSTDDVAGLNRDTSAVNKDIYDVERTKGNVDVTVDTRLFTEDGRKNISEDFKRSEILGQAISDLTESSVSLTGSGEGETSLKDNIINKQDYFSATKSFTEDPGNAAYVSALSDPLATPTEKQAAYTALANSIANQMGVSPTEAIILMEENPQFIGQHSQETGNIYINDANVDSAVTAVDIIGHETQHYVDNQSNPTVQQTSNYTDNRENYADLMGAATVDYLSFNFSQNDYSLASDNFFNIGYSSSEVSNSQTLLSLNELEYQEDQGKKDNCLPMCAPGVGISTGSAESGLLIDGYNKNNIATNDETSLSLVTGGSKKESSYNEIIASGVEGLFDFISNSFDYEENNQDLDPQSKQMVFNKLKKLESQEIALNTEGSDDSEAYNAIYRERTEILNSLSASDYAEAKIEQSQYRSDLIYGISPNSGGFQNSDTDGLTATPNPVSDINTPVIADNTPPEVPEISTGINIADDLSSDTSTPLQEGSWQDNVYFKLSESGEKFRNPSTNEIEELPEGTNVHYDHIFPAKDIKSLPGFSALTPEQQNQVLNYPGNLQLLPARMNCSKGCSIEGTDKPWNPSENVISGGLDPDYREWLQDKQEENMEILQQLIDTLGKSN